MSDQETIYRQDAIDVLHVCLPGIPLKRLNEILSAVPSAHPALHGYNVEHLELIARVLQEENLPPERVAEVLTDIGRIIAIVKGEFEEALRKAVEQCTI